MSSSTIDVARAGYTYADLEALPDDGRGYYELSNGVLVVTPSAGTGHQRILGLVVGFLLEVASPTQCVPPETDLLLLPNLVKRPDVQVVDEGLVGGPCVTGVPSLVVEIHSPATRLLDLTEKRTVYAQAGIPAYWQIDPDVLTLTVLELTAEGRYEELPAGSEGFIAISQPCVMTLDPRSLLAG